MTITQTNLFMNPTMSRYLLRNFEIGDIVWVRRKPIEAPDTSEFESLLTCGEVIAMNLPGLGEDDNMVAPTREQLALLWNKYLDEEIEHINTLRSNEISLINNLRVSV